MQLAASPEPRAAYLLQGQPGNPATSLNLNKTTQELPHRTSASEETTPHLVYRQHRLSKGAQSTAQPAPIPLHRLETAPRATKGLQTPGDTPGDEATRTCGQRAREEEEQDPEREGKRGNFKCGMHFWT